MVREIVLYGDPVLREKCKPVTEITPDLHALAADMLETMEAADGVGLAAPQIGLAIQFAVIDVTGAKEPLTFLKVDGEDTPMEELMPLVFMNPELSFPSKDKAILNEGCLSFPEIRADIRRPSRLPSERSTSISSSRSQRAMPERGRGASAAPMTTDRCPSRRSTPGWWRRSAW